MLVTCLAGENEYFVDESSIVKTDVKWTMTLVHKKPINIDNNYVIAKANATFESLDKYVLHVKIVDANKKRWEPPLLAPKPTRYKPAPLSTMGLEITNNSFGFRVIDPPNGELLLELSERKNGSFQFTDKYLEIGLWFESQSLFGFGERTTTEFELCYSGTFCTYTIWGKDSHTPIDKGKGISNQTYGHQPFYMIHSSQSKNFFGMFVFNSNAQDMVMNKTKDRGLAVTHKMIGGVFDIYIFYPKPNESAESVIIKYHELIGRPYLPPFWTLGFHQSRFGWKDLVKLQEVVAKFEQNDLPLETLWSDIDYMKDFADFTIDPVNYRGLGNFVKSLHRKKIHWVPIIDAGLKYDLNNKYYKLGEQYNAFIRSAITKKTLIARVWPGLAVFLAWYNPKATEVWHVGLQDLYNQVEFDGIWLDMNEVTSFCPGECPPRREVLVNGVKDDPHDPTEFDDLPYVSGQKSLTEMTISLTGYHPTKDPDGDRL
jgi:alpha-glucosidase (family GH31 glycosyl hydrolase)